jgi:hypothetical protein
MQPPQPTRALLHSVVTSADGPDGTGYTVGYVEDPGGGRHLVFATSKRLWEPELLEQLKGHEIALTSRDGRLEVLPLPLQSPEVQLHIAEHLRFSSELNGGTS